MVSDYFQTGRRKRVGRLTVMAGVTAVALLLVLWVRLNALQFVGGAYGCGAISDAIANVQEGRTVIPMVPERESGAAVISKNMVIQGGWDVPGGGGDCSGQGALPQILGKQGLRDAGFVFTAPATRSALNVATDDPVLTISNSVTQLAIEHMALSNPGSLPDAGGGISGTLMNQAEVRLTNLQFANNSADESGGGLYLEVRDGSHLIIEESNFSNNDAGSGGAFEIHVYDNSKVTIRNSVFDGNVADSGNGGAGRIIMHSGQFSITNSLFTNNQTTSGIGGALAIEGTGGEVFILNSIFDGNSAGSQPDVAQVGGSVLVQNLGETVNLPMMQAEFGEENQARITNITLNDSYEYVVEFEAYNFTPVLPGQHLHFFFDTVAPMDRGVPGDGSMWKIHGSSDPFTGYTDTNKPPFATQMCVLVANQNHTVNEGTGNCFRLPVNK